MGLLADRAHERELMVTRQLRDRGVDDPRVLAAFRAVPRELFVREGQSAVAYDDSALPIDAGQTISQPYIVGVMAQALDVRPTDRVLEVGAGSGYVAAILSHLADRVHAIEWHADLAQQARVRLERLGIDNVEIRVGDGTAGWPDSAPFDAIMVSAGGPEVPEPLVEQLAAGGRMIIPIGSRRSQELLRITRSDDGRSMSEDRLGSVIFVPLLSSH